MLKLTVLAIALVCLPALAVEHEVSFTTTAQVGAARLEPGLYKVKVVGSVAMFTSTATGKTYSGLTKPVRVPQRFTFTAVMGSTADGIQRVENIVIAGSEYRLTFNK